MNQYIYMFTYMAMAMAMAFVATGFTATGSAAKGSRPISRPTIKRWEITKAMLLAEAEWAAVVVSVYFRKRANGKAKGPRQKD